MKFPKKNFSVVIPVHNEEKYLSFSFPSIVALIPDEIVVIFDRCTDNSLSKVIGIYENFGKKTKLKKIFVDFDVDWIERVGFLRRLGFKECQNDVILTTDADIILDKKISDYIKFIDGDVKLVKFGFLDYPYTLKSFLRQIYSGFFPFKGYSGLYAFSKRAWLECENLEDAKISPAEDAHLQLSIEKRYRSLHFNTRSLHLRPTEDVASDIKRGWGYAATVKSSPFQVFLMSTLMMRPHTFASYMKWRRGMILKKKF
ncbi:MAG: glycosyltransferase [Candidatus Bathyarchaeia archaeon]